MPNVPGPSVASTSSDVPPDSAISEVVNDAGAVGRDRRNEAALHQIDEHRRQPGLQHVRAQPQMIALSRALRRDDRLDDVLEILRREQIWAATS